MIDRFIDWLVIDRVADQRWWVVLLRTAYGRWVVLPRLVRQMQAAGERGVGTFHGWAEPRTPVTEVGGWFDEQFAVARATRSDYGFIQLVAAHCGAEEWEAGAVVPAEREIFSWRGMAGDWWLIARPGLMRALPQDHAGLYVGLHISGMVWSAGLGLSDGASKSREGRQAP